MLLPSACVLALLAAPPSNEVGSGPQPSATPISWELDFRFEDPQRIEVQVPGQGTQRYWYMVYTVVNPTDRTQVFIPTFQIVTDDLRVIDTDLGIHPAVFQAVQQRYKVRYPYLVPPSRAPGELQSGEDNARESVAIWPDFDLNVDKFSVYVAGLSGETQLVRNPARAGQGGGAATAPAGSDAPVKPHFTLRKTLEIEYHLPGSPASRSIANLRRGQVRWIMR